MRRSTRRPLGWHLPLEQAHGHRLARLPEQWGEGVPKAAARQLAHLGHCSTRKPSDALHASVRLRLSIAAPCSAPPTPASCPLAIIPAKAPVQAVSRPPAAAAGPSLRASALAARAPATSSGAGSRIAAASTAHQPTGTRASVEDAACLGSWLIHD